MQLKPWQMIALLLVVVAIALRLSSKPVDDHPYYHSGLNKPAIIAHQGGAEVWPSNTMYAFTRAAAIADVLEMDIHPTKDGHLVVIHDNTIDRTTNGTGDVESMTLAELKSFDAGYRFTNDDGATYPFRGKGVTIPALEEVFTAFPGKHMTIEIKDSTTPIIVPFCEMIRKHSMQNFIVVASFRDDNIKAFRKECPEVATSSAKTETTVYLLLSKTGLTGFYSPDFYSLQVPMQASGLDVTTKRFIKRAHDRNLAVEPWTINDEETMRLLIEWQVDGIMTDRPDLLRKILDEKSNDNRYELHSN